MRLRGAAVAAWVFLCLAGAFGQAAQGLPGKSPAGDPELEGAVKARIEAAAALQKSDPELANHFGLFETRPMGAEASGKLVVAANIVTSILGTRTSPEDLNALASREKLYSEDIYGAPVVLDGAAMSRLLSLALKGRYAVSLAHRVAGEVPNDEAQEAEASPDMFVTLVYLDRLPMIESGIAWSPTGEMRRVKVTNPLAGAGGPVAYKERSDYDPEAFDAWEFYRFRKSIR